MFVVNRRLFDTKSASVMYNALEDRFEISIYCYYAINNYRRTTKGCYDIVKNYFAISADFSMEKFKAIEKMMSFWCAPSYIMRWTIKVKPLLTQKVDRIFLGYVRDFVSIKLFTFVFNLADLFITAGVICFLIYMIVAMIKEKRNNKKNEVDSKWRRCWL